MSDQYTAKQSPDVAMEASALSMAALLLLHQLPETITSCQIPLTTY
ncbi:MAG: hypothetical protein GY799_02985 [Desulfobulbaceae bacterium]|nr:hypothetical protein [Desulfobulbaceae bacterium]